MIAVQPRDFIETGEGLIFAVVEAEHENDKVLAFLRYTPGPDGLRKIGSEDANRLLRSDYPHYLHYSKRLDAHLHAVPIRLIARHHQPRRRLTHLRQRGARDAIEARLLRLLDLLDRRGVPMEQMGITGSLLIGRQNQASDLDLVAYGRAAFDAARAAVTALIETGDLTELQEEDWLSAYARRGCALDYAEFVRHERRKGNKALVEGTKFDLALVQEPPPASPEPVWRKTGRARIQARVVDDSRVYEQPASYAVDHPVIREILSFTHTYVGQAEAGEFIEAAGTVEICTDGRRRLVVGSSREAPGEYIRVLWGR